MFAISVCSLSVRSSIADDMSRVDSSHMPFVQILLQQVDGCRLNKGESYFHFSYIKLCVCVVHLFLVKKVMHHCCVVKAGFNLLY